MGDMIERQEARTSFGTDPAAYDAGRPDYPDRVYQLLTERCGLSTGTRVVEIGPGTGMATLHLLEAGASVVGIEPDPALARYLRRRVPQAEVIEAAFEDVDLPPASFDLAVAAMSFHWVDQAIGLRKLTPLLRPGAWAALWWTLWRDPDRPDAFGEAATRLHGETPSAANEHGRPQFELDTEGRISDLRSLAGLTEVSHEAIHWSIEVDAKQVRAHYASMIAIQRRPDAERIRLLSALADLVTNDFGGKVERNFLTIFYSGRRPSSSSSNSDQLDRQSFRLCVIQAADTAQASARGR